MSRQRGKEREKNIQKKNPEPQTLHTIILTGMS